MLEILKLLSGGQRADHKDLKIQREKERYAQNKDDILMRRKA